MKVKAKHPPLGGAEKERVPSLRREEPVLSMTPSSEARCSSTVSDLAEDPCDETPRLKDETKPSTETPSKTAFAGRRQAAPRSPPAKKPAWAALGIKRDISQPNAKAQPPQQARALEVFDERKEPPSSTPPDSQEKLTTLTAFAAASGRGSSRDFDARSFRERLLLKQQELLLASLNERKTPRPSTESPQRPASTKLRPLHGDGALMNLVEKLGGLSRGSVCALERPLDLTPSAHAQLGVAGSLEALPPLDVETAVAARRIHSAELPLQRALAKASHLGAREARLGVKENTALKEETKERPLKSPPSSSASDYSISDFTISSVSSSPKSIAEEGSSEWKRIPDQPPRASLVLHDGSQEEAAPECELPEGPSSDEEDASPVPALKDASSLASEEADFSDVFSSASEEEEAELSLDVSPQFQEALLHGAAPPSEETLRRRRLPALSSLFSPVVCFPLKRRRSQDASAKAPSSQAVLHKFQNTALHGAPLESRKNLLNLDCLTPLPPPVSREASLSESWNCNSPKLSSPPASSDECSAKEERACAFYFRGVPSPGRRRRGSAVVSEDFERIVLPPQLRKIFAQTATPPEEPRLAPVRLRLVCRLQSKETPSRLSFNSSSSVAESPSALERRRSLSLQGSVDGCVSPGGDRDGVTPRLGEKGRQLFFPSSVHALPPKGPKGGPPKKKALGAGAAAASPWKPPAALPPPKEDQGYSAAPAQLKQGIFKKPPAPPPSAPPALAKKESAQKEAPPLKPLPTSQEAEPVEKKTPEEPKKLPETKPPPETKKLPETKPPPETPKAPQTKTPEEPKKLPETKPPPEAKKLPEAKLPPEAPKAPQTKEEAAPKKEVPAAPPGKAASGETGVGLAKKASESEKAAPKPPEKKPVGKVIKVGFKEPGKTEEAVRKDALSRA